MFLVDWFYSALASLGKSIIMCMSVNDNQQQTTCNVQWWKVLNRSLLQLPEMPEKAQREM